MGGFTITHWIVVAIVILVLFGRGKISETMGDFGKGLKSFKRGLAEDDAADKRPVPPPQLGQSSAEPVTVKEASPNGADGGRTVDP